MTVPVAPVTFTASIASGSTTVFPYGFMIADDEDIAVTLDGVLQTSGYTVSGAGNPAGGDVTFLVAPPVGTKVVRYLAPILKRETDYQQFGDWKADVVNPDFDRVWLAMQALDQNTSRSLKLPIDTEANQEITEDAAARANKCIKFDAGGNMTVSLFDPDEAQQAGADAIAAAEAAAESAAVALAAASALPVVSAGLFGAVGDGVTDDTDAIQAAADSLNGAGGVVYLPPTGHAYVTSDTIALPNGVVLSGSLAKNFAGSTATNAQWSAAGSWLNPTHASNPAVRLQGHGSGIYGIGFIHNQPIPSGTWTPNIYGYCIEDAASHTTIEDILIVNASHGIHFKYTTGSGGGTQTRMRDVIISAFAVRARTSCVNDTMYWSNIHMRNLWYSSNALVTAYIRANTKGWYCGYTDNIMVDGIEFFEDSIAMYFEDETCLGNTHSLYNATISNAQFNLPQVCMKVENSTTSVAANFANTISQTGNAFGYTWADTAFQLGSDNVNMKFNGLTVRDAGGQVFTIGGGAGGKVVVDNLDIDKYSSVSSGQLGIAINAGALLRLANYRIVKIAGAGLRFAGGGLENVSTDAYGQIMFFGRFSEASTTGDGSYKDLSTSSNFRPGQARVHQVRLLGDLNVTTAQAASTANVRMGGGLSEPAVTGINTSTTGWKTFDTGWVDLLETTLTALSVIGRIQVQAGAGVIMSNGSIQLLYR